MKVAIIGAGVSGLACAHELEKCGIEAVIYERNSFIGEQISHVASLLQVTHRSVKDELLYMQDKLDIDITPLNTINTIIYKSPGKTVEIKGELGYFISRGRENNDLKKQIFSSLKNVEIRFNENVDYNKLKDIYDFVIIASGEPSMAMELGCWQQWFQGYERSACVVGRFDPNTLMMWINKDYCKNGFAFLAPFDNKRAFITLVVSDVNGKEIDYFWDEFMYTENIKYMLVNEFKLQHLCGHVYPRKVDNIYLVGNAGGAVDSFLNFGLFNSIAMGVMAARSIAYGKDYEKLTRHITCRNKLYNKFRKNFNLLDNEDYDSIVNAIELSSNKNKISPLRLGKYSCYLNNRS